MDREAAIEVLRPPQRSERVDDDEAVHLPVDMERPAWRLGERRDAVIDVAVAAPGRGVEHRRDPAVGHQQEQVVGEVHLHEASDPAARRGHDVVGEGQLRPGADHPVRGDRRGLLLQRVHRLLRRITEHAVRQAEPVPERAEAPLESEDARAGVPELQLGGPASGAALCSSSCSSSCSSAWWSWSRCWLTWAPTSWGPLRGGWRSGGQLRRRRR